MRPPAPRLDLNDVDRLGRLTAAARHVLHPVLEGDVGRKEPLRGAFSVADWHRRAEPDAYGRQPGDRP